MQESRVAPDHTWDRPEHLSVHPDTKIVLVRHGEYEGMDGAQDNIGFLTYSGIEQVRDDAKQLVNEVLLNRDSTDFYFINSPTAFDDTAEEPYGTRAEQSAVEMMDEIARQIDIAPQGRLAFWRQGSLNSSALAEPNIHSISTAEDPTAYIKAQVKKYGKEGRWEGYHRGDSEVDATAEQIGAETSADVAHRVIDQVRELAELEKQHRQERPGRGLIFILVTHNDNLRSLVQYGLGAGDAAYGYQPAYGEMLGMTLKDGKVTVRFNGQEYSKDLYDQETI